MRHMIYDTISYASQKEAGMKRLSSEVPKGVPLVDCLETIKDPRVNRTQDHKLIDILVIGVCSVICGGTGFTDMETFGLAQQTWLRVFWNCPTGSRHMTPLIASSAPSNHNCSWTVSSDGLSRYAPHWALRSSRLMERPCGAPTIKRRPSPMLSAPGRRRTD